MLFLRPEAVLLGTDAADVSKEGIAVVFRGHISFI